ncbi:MAG: TIGR00266 family protein [Anaerolineales bacterium]|jgi:uncharacterized protein (TIGR00266 family)|nr:TIGR00266 family protein [Anaerolineales bacterium]
MEIELKYSPSYSLAIVKLEPNERVRAEAGAMVSMSASVSIETKAEGGLLKSLGRTLLGGESFFQNCFQAGQEGGEVTLAPELPGDITLIELTNNNCLMIQAGSYLASEMGIDLTAKISMKAFLSAEGISMLEAIGAGKILVSSYGAIFERVLKENEKYVVDTSHLVAFEGGMTVIPRTSGGIKATLFSGEGLVVEMSGPGRVYIQTRSPHALINWIIPQLPRPSSNNG